MMAAFAEDIGQPLERLVFQADGDDITDPNSTPEDFDMVDGECVDARYTH